MMQFSVPTPMEVEVGPESSQVLILMDVDWVGGNKRKRSDENYESELELDEKMFEKKCRCTLDEPDKENLDPVLSMSGKEEVNEI